MKTTITRFLLPAALLCALFTSNTFAQGNTSVIEGEGGWLFPGWERSDQYNSARVDTNIRLIAETKALLAARNIQLLVMVVPAKTPFYPARLPANLNVSSQIKSRYQDILGLLTKNGITTFDDLQVLRTLENAGSSAFYRADYHWTALAAEASADASASIIRTQWTLAPAKEPGEVLGEWTNERRYGDLAMNFMSPDDRKRIGRDVYTVRKLKDAGSGALLESSPAKIQVIGNSFIQPYLGYPQKLSNALNQPVAVTWNPGNIGPWKTFIDAASNPEFKQRQIVVWQFNESQLEFSPDTTDIWDAKGIMPAAEWKNKVMALLK